MMTLAFIYRIAGFRDFDSWRQTQPADLRLFRQLVLLASSWIYNRHHRELMTFPWRFMVLADSRTTAAERAQVKVQETSENAHSPLQACLKRKHTCVLQAQPVIITYHQRVERSAVIVLTVSMSSAFVSQPRSRPRSSTWSWSWIALSNLGLSLSLSLSFFSALLALLAFPCCISGCCGLHVPPAVRLPAWFRTASSSPSRRRGGVVHGDVHQGVDRDLCVAAPLHRKH